MTANTPQSRKAKGRRFQQYIRERLIDVFGLDPADVESRSMGASGIDIQLSRAARDKFPFATESKHQERLNIWDAWKQAETNGEKDGLTPLLIIRRNRQKPLAVLDLEDFLEIIK